jgi:hypothetical protein
MILLTNSDLLRSPLWASISSSSSAVNPIPTGATLFDATVAIIAI